MAAPPDALAARLTAALGSAPTRLTALAGGCIAEVHRVDLADGRTVVIKVDSGAAPQLAIEARMLTYLRQHSALPVPTILHSEPDLLVLEFLAGGPVRTPAQQRHAGELLAALHTHTAPEKKFGFGRDTLIGPLRQPNPWTARWVDFFREHRLLYMAREAHRAGQLSADLLRRIERFAPRLDRLIPEPPQPSLLHGDAWSGNLLAAGDRVTGFIDPAVYYGDPEIELAFTRLFHSFGPALYDRYAELRPIPKEFFTARSDLYNLYPLLVHTRLFGGGYAGQVQATLARFE